MSTNKPITFSSDAGIKRLPTREKRYEAKDTGSKGLRVRVSPNGVKSFIWRFRKSDGKAAAVTIGKYPEVSLKDARIKLLELIDQHSTGELDKKQDGTTTLADLCDLFYDVRIKPLRRPDVVKQRLEADVKAPFGSIKLSKLSTDDVINIIKKITGRGAHVHAGKVFSDLKSMFVFAKGRKLIEENPAESLTKIDIGIRDNNKSNKKRVLSMDEITTFFQVLDDHKRMSIVVKTALKFLTYIPVRSGELIQSDWSEFDFDSNIWTIPASHSKTGESWQVALPETAIELLLSLPADKDGNRTGKVLNVADKTLSRALKRLFEGKEPALTMEAFTPHDLRRTTRSHLSRLDVKIEIAEKCLNHSLNKFNEVMEVYNQYNYLDERLAALQLWEKELNKQL